MTDHSKRGFFDEGAAPADLIDDLPTSSRAAEVRTALAMVDREREMREELRAEVERLREARSEAVHELSRVIEERDAARNGRQGADAAVRVLEAERDRLREELGYFKTQAVVAREAETEAEHLRDVLGTIADKAKYLSEPAWNLEGCALVGQQIFRDASAALDEQEADRG